MNGWSSHAGADRWDDEPGWIYEITWEWEPLPGQRYPGDEGRRRAVHTPVYEVSRTDDASPADDERGVGRAMVGPPPAQPPAWTDPSAYPDNAQDSVARPARDEPSWNRPVPLPERLPDGRSPRPSQPPPAGPPQYDQRTPFRDARPNLQDALASYYGPRMAPQEPPPRRDGRPGPPPQRDGRPAAQRGSAAQRDAGSAAPRDGQAAPAQRDGVPRRDGRSGPEPGQRDGRSQPARGDAQPPSQGQPPYRDGRSLPPQRDTSAGPAPQREAPLRDGSGRPPYREPRPAPPDTPPYRDARPPASYHDDPRPGPAYRDDPRHAPHTAPPSSDGRSAPQSAPPARDGLAAPRSAPPARSGRPDAPLPGQRPSSPSGFQSGRPGPQDGPYPASAAPSAAPEPPRGFGTRPGQPGGRPDAYRDAPPQDPRRPAASHQDTRGQDRAYPGSPAPHPSARPQSPGYPSSSAPYQGGGPQGPDHPGSPAPYQGGRPQGLDHPGSPPPYQGGRPQGPAHPGSPAPYQGGRPQDPSHPGSPAPYQGGRPAPAAYQGPPEPSRYDQRTGYPDGRPGPQEPPLQGRRPDTQAPYIDARPGTPGGPLYPEARSQTSGVPASRHDVRPANEGYREADTYRDAGPQSPAPQYDGRRRAPSDTTPPYRPLPQIRPGTPQPGAPDPASPPVRPASYGPASPAASAHPAPPVIAPRPASTPPASAPPPVIPPRPAPAQPPVIAPRPASAQPPVIAPRPVSAPPVVRPASAPPARPQPPVIAPRSAAPAPPAVPHPAAPQPPIVAPRSAVPAPPPVVSRQPMPPIVAEPPTPTRLTPPTAESAHYRAAPPTSPYEPQPRHAPAPRPEQDAPIRPELPPERQAPREAFARPRDETGERTDDLHLEQRRDLSSAPAPTPRYGYPAEPVELPRERSPIEPMTGPPATRAYDAAVEPVTAPPADADAPILIPLEPLYPASPPTPAAPVSAEPVSSAPTSPASWFDAPTSAPPALDAEAIMDEATTTADLLPDEDPAPAEPETVQPERIDTDSEPAIEAGTADEDAHGLGWLLSLSGLGATASEAEAETSEPVSAQPVSAQPTSAQPADALADESLEAFAPEAAVVETPETGGAEPERPVSGMPAQPVSGAPDGVDWFVPATDPRMQLPDRAKIGPTEDEDTPAEAELIEVEPAAAEPIDAESTQDVSTQDVLSLVEPAATHQTDAEPIRVEPTPSGETAGTLTGGTVGDSELDVATKQPESGSAADVAKTEADDDHVETDTSKVGETTADVGGTTAEIAPTGEVELEKLEEEPERRLVDPEQVLAAYAWRFDPETLREQADDPDQLRAVRDRLTDKLEYAERHAVRARLLSLRAVIGRVLGDYGRAVADGRMALKHAEATGELRRISIAQARLAHVLQWRGDYAAADRMFEEANSAELPDRLRSEMSELAGRSAYEQGRYLEAVNHFERALDVRRGEDPQLIARIEQALDAVQGKIHAKEDWGPYPRTREELLQQPGALHPTLGFESQLWGYADHDGELIIPERYADARPFHDGVAWVLRPQGRAWELIDAEGTVLIDQFSGYLAVGPFAEGLAWVSRDATGGWFAINRDNRVIVAGGFDDVRSFHSGLAPVRRVGWGAVDRHGRLVVQPKFLGFATALTSGRHLDGFTDEGHAVVDAGDRKGVVDRTGNLIVPPVHPALLIHPVAFVIGGRDGRWGALDRQGAPLIDVVHASQAEVADEIDRLLADTRPVL